MAVSTVLVPTIHPEDEVLALSQAAQELGLSKQGLLYAHIRGHLAMREAGGRFLVRRQDLEAYKRWLAARGYRGGRPRKHRGA